jgi:hypothetical protein
MARAWEALGLLVAIASAVIAWRAKAQAKKTALLEPRTKAINHVRQAYFDVTNNGLITRDTLNSLLEAMEISRHVFSCKVRRKLDQARGCPASEQTCRPPL